MRKNEKYNIDKNVRDAHENIIQQTSAFNP